MMAAPASIPTGLLEPGSGSPRACQPKMLTPVQPFGANGTQLAGSM